MNDKNGSPAPAALIEMVLEKRETTNEPYVLTATMDDRSPPPWLPRN
jgi:hypothetical protein